MTTDNKCFTRVIIAAEIIDAVASTNLHYPKAIEEKLWELAGTKKAADRELMVLVVNASILLVRRK